jgi:hypothetical protein
MSREQSIDRFYAILYELELKLSGKKKLSSCTGRMNWPKRGVYFFFEDGETRENGEPRVVRIGTHALKCDSKTTLWKRLSQHRGNLRGTQPGGGSHRVSVFRLHVGTAIIARAGLEVPTWSVGNSADANVRYGEYPIEKKVSGYISQMPFLWLNIDDEPGPSSNRGYIERNAIALLSNHDKKPQIDPPSPRWLGNFARPKEIRESGLWNVKHVDEIYDPGFLDILRSHVTEMTEE